MRVNSEEIIKKLGEELPEMNTNDGLDFSAGNADAYLKLLKVVYSTCLGSSKKDECVSVASDGKYYVEARNTNAFTIYVHGIKSTLKSIGANDLSERARQLEMAAKALNFDFIKDKSKTFFDDYEDFLETLKETMEGFRSPEEEQLKTLLSKEDVIELINYVISYIGEYEIDDAESCFDKLADGVTGENIGEENLMLLLAAKNALMSYDYEKMEERLKTVLKNLGE